MRNFDKYEAELGEIGVNFAVDNRTHKPVHCNGFKCENCCLKDDCNKHRIKWLYEECKEPILTDEEKEYLENVIRPFKDKVCFITKSKDELGFELLDFDTYDYNFSLPNLDLRYKGMKTNHDYQLKELGLFEGEEK